MFCTGCVKALYFCLKISVALISYHSNDIVCDSLLICKDLIHYVEPALPFRLRAKLLPWILATNQE